MGIFSVFFSLYVHSTLVLHIVFLFFGGNEDLFHAILFWCWVPVHLLYLSYASTHNNCSYIIIIYFFKTLFLVVVLTTKYLVLYNLHSCPGTMVWCFFMREKQKKNLEETDCKCFINEILKAQLLASLIFLIFLQDAKLSKYTCVEPEW